MSRRILVLCPYPSGKWASQRFATNTSFPTFGSKVSRWTNVPFSMSTPGKFCTSAATLPKRCAAFFADYASRFFQLLRARSYDSAYIHLEASPVGPPFVEAGLVAAGVPFVYDIDDAHFMAATSGENKLASRLRWRSKVAWISKKAAAVTVVNPFVEEWARRHNARVMRLPTMIDPGYHCPKPDRPKSDLPVIGWTGSQSTLKYLETAYEWLCALQEHVDFELRVICNKKPHFPRLRRVKFVPWRMESEIEDLHAFDVGIMPVPNTTWALGKVGFKAIQYGAVGLPSVVSDIGEGGRVVLHDDSGFVVPNESEPWVHALTRLVRDSKLRERMGQAARDHILATYSTDAHREAFLSLVNEVSQLR